ncbi:MAG: hypothetical protein ASARMPRED_006762 [Alectoria sarmentosa]|nr:MAG: hypothetical protein ASARMPRED_006762 [Alectoria sarmentosa]
MTKTPNSSFAPIEVSSMFSPKSKGRAVDGGVVPSDETKKSEKTSAYDKNFMIILAERNIEASKRTQRPANYDELVTLLEQPRSSLSSSNFSDRDFDQFLDAVDNVRTELMMMNYVFSRILGSTSYPFIMDKSCTNWAPLVTDAELVTSQPDYYDGIRVGPENKLLRQYLDKIIMPAFDAFFLSNFFTEAKAPRGSMEIATMQAVYDGALGARAMHYTRNTNTSTNFDSKSYTFNATYANGFLKLYAHFLTQADEPTTSIHYHMTPLDSWALEHSVKAFREGITAFRNLRDRAHQMRTEIADVTTQKLRALTLSRQLLPTLGLSTNSTTERDESQDNSDTLTSVIESESQELIPSEIKRQLKPKKTMPKFELRVKISKADLKVKAKAKPRSSSRST